MPLQDGSISWSGLLRAFAKLDIVSVLIEGGSTVAASALKKKIVDKALFFYAPKILGGDAFPMFGPLGIRHARDAIALKGLQVQKSGLDFMISAYLR